MAGYGTTMHVQAARDELMALLMAAAKRRAKAAALDFGYSSEADGDITRWTLQVDGHGFRIAAWSHQLERDLPIVAEGYPSLPTQIAVGFADSVVARWFADCIGTSDQDDTREAVIGDDGEVNRWWWPILATGFEELSDQARQRLTQADLLVGRWLVGELPAETIIEEVHTIAEAVLRTFTGKKGKNDGWRVLVDAARKQRLLTLDDAAVLTRFNSTYRNRLKHEAEVLAAGEDDQALVSDVIRMLDHVEQFGARPLTDEAAAGLDRLKMRMTALEADVYSEGGREPRSR